MLEGQLENLKGKPISLIFSEEVKLEIPVFMLQEPAASKEMKDTLIKNCKDILKTVKILDPQILQI